MASTQTVCVGQYQACVLRAVRLGPDCAPLTGPNAGVITSGLATLSIDPEIEEGDVFEPKNACGQFCWSVKDCDRIKRVNIDLELCVWDFELIEMLTGSALVMGDAAGPYAGQAIGVSMGCSDQVCPDGVSLEIWTKNASGTGKCGEAGVPFAPYTRHVLPRVFLQMGSRTFENDVALVSLSGTGEANPSWGQGAFGDWVGEGDLACEPYTQAWDDILPTVGCGYVDIP